MARAIGIDLGTTFSAVGAINSLGKPEIILNSEGERLTPSVVYLGEDRVVVGKEAKELQALGDAHVASFFKRVMGDSHWVFPARDRLYTPVDLSALVLEKLKSDAEAALGEEVSHAVITVPAYFSDLQRRNTIEAGQQAGLTVLRIINEPTAAAIAYGMEKFAANATILVYDLGGGTFDVTLVQIEPEQITVLATDGNHELGGKDWDDAILRHAAAQFEAEFDLDPLSDPLAFSDLLVRAEQAKRALSAANQTTIMISYGGKAGRYVLDRQTFERQTANLMEMTIKLVEQVLEDAGLSWPDLGGVLCIGGSTRMPAVHRYISEKTGQPPLSGINVDEAVALGAAIQAEQDFSSHPEPGSVAASRAFSLGPVREIRDVMSHSLGMVAINEDRSRYINSILIPKNHPVPSEESRPYQFRTSARRANEMEVYITQGESERPLDCTILGKYCFRDIPHHAESGTAVLDIAYAYDQNGVVQVSARERHSGQDLEPVVEAVPDDLSWMDQPPEEARMVMEHLSLYIAIDLSGSMDGRPLAEAKKAAHKFVSQLDLAHTSVGLIAVADRVKTVLSLSQNARKISRAIDSLSIGMVGYGNSGQPFSEARKLLGNPEGLRFVLVLADGVWSKQSYAVQEACKCHDDGIEVVAIGFGSADKRFLRDIASSEEGALLTDLGSLMGSFDRVAQVLTERGGGVTPLEQAGPDSGKKRGLFSFFGKSS